MMIILDEDLSKINNGIYNIVKVLGMEMKRAELEVTVGEDTSIAKITGYWINDIIRIDIQFKDSK